MGLMSDQKMIARGGPSRVIGMSEIKQRRVEKLEVSCHPGTKVGDYVPFFFCPRSVMLYVIYCANHHDLEYRDGQDRIVHLEADLYGVIDWAEANDVPWAFSYSNAGARYADFGSSRDELVNLDWNAIAAHDWRDSEVRTRKQAEFLVYDQFPFELVERIGVQSQAVMSDARRAIGDGAHQPLVQVQQQWYY